MVIAAAVINIFMGNSIAFMAINAGIALLMTGFILFDTSRIVNGGGRTTFAQLSHYTLRFLKPLHRAVAPYGHRQR